MNTITDLFRDRFSQLTTRDLIVQILSMPISLVRMSYGNTPRTNAIEFPDLEVQKKKDPYHFRYLTKNIEFSAFEQLKRKKAEDLENRHSPVTNAVKAFASKQVISDGEVDISLTMPEMLAANSELCENHLYHLKTLQRLLEELQTDFDDYAELPQFSDLFQFTSITKELIQLYISLHLKKPLEISKTLNEFFANSLNLPRIPDIAINSDPTIETIQKLIQRLTDLTSDCYRFSKSNRLVLFSEYLEVFFSHLQQTNKSIDSLLKPEIKDFPFIYINADSVLNFFEKQNDYQLLKDNINKTYEFLLTTDFSSINLAEIKPVNFDRVYMLSRLEDKYGFESLPKRIKKALRKIHALCNQASWTEPQKSFLREIDIPIIDNTHASIGKTAEPPGEKSIKYRERNKLNRDRFIGTERRKLIADKRKLYQHVNPKKPKKDNHIEEIPSVPSSFFELINYSERENNFKLIQEQLFHCCQFMTKFSNNEIRDFLLEKPAFFDRIYAISKCTDINKIDSIPFEIDILIEQFNRLFSNLGLNSSTILYFDALTIPEFKCRETERELSVNFTKKYAPSKKTISHKKNELEIFKTPLDPQFEHLFDLDDGEKLPNLLNFLKEFKLSSKDMYHDDRMSKFTAIVENVANSFPINNFLLQNALAEFESMVNISQIEISQDMLNLEKTIHSDLQKLTIKNSKYSNVENICNLALIKKNLTKFQLALSDLRKLSFIDPDKTFYSYIANLDLRVQNLLRAINHNHKRFIHSLPPTSTKKLEDISRVLEQWENELSFFAPDFSELEKIPNLLNIKKRIENLNLGENKEITEESILEIVNLYDALHNIKPEIEKLTDGKFGSYGNELVVAIENFCSNFISYYDCYINLDLSMNCKLLRVIVDEINELSLYYQNEIEAVLEKNDDMTSIQMLLDEIGKLPNDRIFLSAKFEPFSVIESINSFAILKKKYTKVIEFIEDGNLHLLRSGRLSIEQCPAELTRLLEIERILEQSEYQIPKEIIELRQLFNWHIAREHISQELYLKLSLSGKTSYFTKKDLEEDLITKQKYALLKSRLTMINDHLSTESTDISGYSWLASYLKAGFAVSLSMDIGIEDDNLKEKLKQLYINVKQRFSDTELGLLFIEEAKQQINF